MPAHTICRNNAQSTEVHKNPTPVGRLLKGLQQTPAAIWFSLLE